MKRLSFFLSLCLLLSLTLPAQVTLFPFADSWKYLANGTDPGTAWRMPAFSDAAWSTGKGKFGYGMDGIATTLSYGSSSSNKYITYYFRKTVAVSDPGIYSSFTASLAFDDGVVLYVNGVEVYRGNLPTGTIAYNTLAASSSNSSKTVTLNRNAFAPGTNVVAAEVHQVSPSNGDLAFDMKLVANPDVTAPAVLSSNRLSPAASKTNAASVTFRVSFSEKVSGVDVSDFTVTPTSGTPGGRVTALVPAGIDGASWDVTVGEIGGTGALRLDVKASGTGITDAVGKALASGFTAGQAYTIDRVAPTILSINRQLPTTVLTNAASLTFRATFSEAMAGVDAADFTPVALDGTVGGTVQSVVPSGSTGTLYDITVAPVSGSGTLRLLLNASGTGITDVATNGLAGGFTTGQTYTVDQAAPYVQGIARQSPLEEITKASTVYFRVIFSEKVTSVGVSDFSVVAASGNVQGTIASGDVDPVGTDGTTYQVKVTSVSGTGVLRLDLKASGTGIVDAAQNACGGYTAGQPYRIDKTAPAVQAIGRFSPATVSTNGASVVYRTVFTEAVRGVDAADFSLTTVSGTAKGVIGAVTLAGPDSTAYDVQVTSLTGNGQLRLNVKSSGTGIVDVVGHELSSGYTSGQSYTLDHTAPTVLSVSRLQPSTALTNAAALTFRVVFSEGVTGLTAGAFSLSNPSGAVSGTLSDAGILPADATGTAWDVTVRSVSGNGSLRLDVRSTGSGITDIATNGLNGGFTGGQAYTLDQAAPVVAGIVRQSPQDETTNAPSIVWRVTFSEKVTGVDPSDFSLATLSGTASGSITSVAAVGTAGTTFDITAGSVVTYSTVRLEVKTDGGITDMAANRLTTAYTDGQRFQVDPPPVVAGMYRLSPAEEVTKASSVTFRVVFSEKVTGVDPADFVLTRLSGTSSGSLAANAVVGGSDGTTYDVTVGSLSTNQVLRLDVKSSGTGITDSYGSPLAGGYTSGPSYYFDYTRPVVSSINRQAPLTATTNLPAITWRIVFSESVAGVDVSDFTLTTISGTSTGALQSVAPANGEGTAYDVTVGGITRAVGYRLDLKSSGTGILDVVGNSLSGGFSSGQSYTIEYTPPTVSGIDRYAPSDQTTTQSSVVYRVSFSEGVTGVDVSDFTLTALSGTLNGVLEPTAVTPANTTGTKYDVRVSSITKAVKLRLDLNTTHGITDIAGNALSGGYTSGENYIIDPAPAGSVTVSTLAPLSISSTTEHKPQSKVWHYDGRWWTVLGTSDGTKLFRLDGATWTPVLTLYSSGDVKADCWVVGNVTHILLFRESSTSYLVSVEYDAAAQAYKLWSQRTSRVSLSLGSSTEVATLLVDGTGRMWIANDGSGDVGVRWSDAPYTSWSSRYVLATGATSDDICTLALLQGKIGVLWSNQNSERFGFRTHTDGEGGSTWSEDEVPGAQSAKNVGLGFSDDHMNVVTGSDGTLYCAVKTSYDTDNYPKESLLIRRPAGTWDNIYTVTENENGGTRGIIVVNEKAGKLKIVYTSVEDGGNILYRESSISNISFGSAKTLLSGDYNDATSTHQTYSSEVVVLATNLSTGTAEGVVLTDGAATATSAAPALTEAPARPLEGGERSAGLSAAPNPFTGSVTVSFTLPQSGAYSLVLEDLGGTQHRVVKKGRAEAGQRQTFTLEEQHLGGGLYLLRLQTAKGSQTLKLVSGK
ncbi:hypothetical protein V9K67_00320 [Paraflavisolibacter sp. H34]|uniref:beta strand repeat-containing protein n=1 Tax=Huijunlia imazamoxiresistens TaxID=3127457 RepID=UPI0030191CB9